MANTTFSGAVRSENGFSDITKNSTTGSITSTMTLSTYEATITVANGATTGKEAAIGIPSNFIPMGVLVAVTTAASNSVTLNDIGTDAELTALSMVSLPLLTLQASRDSFPVTASWACPVAQPPRLQKLPMR